MRKKRVLFLTEATYLSTGYAVYAKNILSRLYNSGKYEIAEFSIYGTENHPSRKKIKWKSYPNMPSVEEQELYASSYANQFGEWRFERVCLDFKPDTVCSIRDFWMDSFIYRSPYRRIFNWIWMPTVDAYPQHKEWLHVFGSTDALITYSDWAAKSITEQMGSCVNLVGVASPSAEDCFKPVLNKKEHRAKMGVPEDINIVGTVMRNQRRKLFPALFEAFGQYLKKTGNTNTYLYCHTSYPDNGWDIGTLLIENEISSRVLFSYYCDSCKTLEVCRFNDSCKQCNSCKRFNCKPVSVSNGVSSETLSDIYNLFDLYVQPASSEGFGLPQVEAAACGVPIATVGHSAMNDLIEHVGAYQIPSTYYREMETGCDRAVISPESLCEIFVDFFSKKEEDRLQAGKDSRAGFDKRYNWEHSGNVWMNAIDQLPVANWKIPPVIKNVTNIPNDLNNKDFVKYCCDKFLIDPKMAYSYFGRSMQRDLNYGTTKGGVGGYFYSDMSVAGRIPERPFSREDAVKMFQQMNEKSNFWENVRVGNIKIKDESWLK